MPHDALRKRPALSTYIPCYRKQIGSSVNEAPRTRRERITIFQVCRMPDRPPQLTPVNFCPSLYASSATARLGDGFLLQSGCTPLRKEPLIANEEAGMD